MAAYATARDRMTARRQMMQQTLKDYSAASLWPSRALSL